MITWMISWIFTNPPKNDFLIPHGNSHYRNFRKLANFIYGGFVKLRDLTTVIIFIFYLENDIKI